MVFCSTEMERTRNIHARTRASPCGTGHGPHQQHVNLYNWMGIMNATILTDLYVYTNAFSGSNPQQWPPNRVSEPHQMSMNTNHRHRRLLFGQRYWIWMSIHLMSSIQNFFSFETCFACDASTAPNGTWDWDYGNSAAICSNVFYLNFVCAIARRVPCEVYVLVNYAFS